MKRDTIMLRGSPETWADQACNQLVSRARNWGLVCGFGYGFAAATFAFLVMMLRLIASMPGG